MALILKNESDESDTSAAAAASELSREFRACCTGHHLFFRIS